MKRLWRRCLGAVLAQVEKPADFNGCLCIRTVFFISLIKVRAKRFEKVRVSRCTRSIRMSATSVGSSVRLTPPIASDLFSASASRSASASEALSDRV